MERPWKTLPARIRTRPNPPFRMSFPCRSGPLPSLSVGDSQGIITAVSTKSRPGPRCGNHLRSGSLRYWNRLPLSRHSPCIDGDGDSPRRSCTTLLAARCTGDESVADCATYMRWPASAWLSWAWSLPRIVPPRMSAALLVHGHMHPSGVPPGGWYVRLEYQGHRLVG